MVIITVAVIIGISALILLRAETEFYSYYAEGTAYSIAAMLDEDMLVKALNGDVNDQELTTLREELCSLQDDTGADKIRILGFDVDADSTRIILDTTDEDALGKTVEEVSVYKRIYQENVRGDLGDWNCMDVVPVNSLPIKGITLYVMVNIPMKTAVEAETTILIGMIIAGIIAAALLSILAAVTVGRYMVSPIYYLGKRADTFINRRTRGEEIFTKAEKSLEKRLEKRSDEIGILSRSLAKMEEDTLAYIEDIEASTKERQKTAAELDTAAAIQYGILPSAAEFAAQHAGLELYASMVTAQNVGGDFYDFFRIDEDHAAFVIADVSGKGMPAALFMMTVKGLIKTHCLMGMSPSACLTAINKAICERNIEDMFVTVWLGILTLSTGQLTMVNAGHEYPALCRKDGCFELILSKHDLVVGGMPEVIYREESLTLEKGDTLFLYTDGIPEATSAEKELFGNDRMLSALNRACGASPQAIAEAVKADVAAFVGDAPQFDDMTMLVLTYRGEEAEV